jgi:hypothetical protein
VCLHDGDFGRQVSHQDPEAIGGFQDHLARGFDGRFQTVGQQEGIFLEQVDRSRRGDGRSVHVSGS